MDERIRVRCLCGIAHTLTRAAALRGLAVTRRKCAGCKRRFTILCTPGDGRRPDKFTAMFLDDIPPRGDTQEIAISADGPPSTVIPKTMSFQCRCGCRLMARSRMYGRKTKCPKCNLRIKLHLTYRPEDGTPVLGLEYSEA